MTKPPATATASFVLLLLNASVWLVFALIVLSGIHPTLPVSDLAKTVIGALALLASAVLILLAILVRRRNKVAYVLTLGALTVLTVLTIADEVGLADLAVLAIAVTPLVLLIKDRRWFLGGTPPSPPVRSS